MGESLSERIYHNETFEQQTFSLDEGTNHVFENCQFHKCAFRYGGGSFAFLEGCKIVGKTKLEFTGAARTFLRQLPSLFNTANVEAANRMVADILGGNIGARPYVCGSYSFDGPEYSTIRFLETWAQRRDASTIAAILAEKALGGIPMPKTNATRIEATIELPFYLALKRGYIFSLDSYGEFRDIKAEIGITTSKPKIGNSDTGGGSINIDLDQPGVFKVSTPPWDFAVFENNIEQSIYSQIPLTILHIAMTTDKPLEEICWFVGESYSLTTKCAPAIYAALLAIANRVVLAYVAATEEVYNVRPLRPLCVSDLSTGLKNIKVTDINSGKFFKVLSIQQLQSTNLDVRASNVNLTIQKYFQNPAFIPLERELLNGALRNIYTGEYRQAILESALAVETYVDNYLASKTSRYAFDDTQQKYLYDKTESLSPLNRFGKPLKNLKKPQLFDKDPKLWLAVDILFNVRNNIAHRGLCQFQDNPKAKERRSKIRPHTKLRPRPVDMNNAKKAYWLYQKARAAIEFVAGL